MKDAKLQLAGIIIQEFGPSSAKKRELSKLEKSLCEWALKFSAKAFMPPQQAREAIAEFDAEIAKERERAEAARRAREQKKEGPVITGGLQS